MDDINKVVCNYISKHWIAESKSNRSFARDHNINERIVRKILKPDGYRIPLETLSIICDAKNISLSLFFNKTYFGDVIVHGFDDIFKK